MERNYELVLVISPKVEESAIPAQIERVSKFVADKGGSMGEVKQWGKRKLAYPIRSFSEGNYILTQFKLGAQHTAALEAGLKLSEDVLRHLLVRVEAGKKGLPVPTGKAGGEIGRTQ